MSEILSGIANAIPSLSTLYSGVPERLAKEAVATKQRLFSQRTTKDNIDRKRLALPPGVDQAAYDAAIAQLRDALGNENVQLNDKPLIDGWYLQHP